MNDALLVQGTLHQTVNKKNNKKQIKIGITNDKRMKNFGGFLHHFGVHFLFIQIWVIFFRTG